MISGRDQLPRKVRLLVSGLAVLAIVAVVAAIVEVDRMGPRPVLVDVLAVSAIVLVGDVPLLQIRFGRNSVSFTWSEAALVTGAALGGWPLMLVLTGVVLLLKQVAARRAPHKALFNASTAVLGVLLAWLCFALVRGQWTTEVGPVTMRTAAALATAAAASFLWVGVTLALAVGWSQDVPIREVWGRGLRLRLVIFGGNTAAGLGIVAVGDSNRGLIVALPFVALAAYVLYYDYVRAQQERDAWRELHQVTSGLDRADSSALLRAVRHEARVLFGAEVTGLLPGLDELPTPGLLARALLSRRPVQLQARQEHGPVLDEMRALGVETAVLARLGPDDDSLGALLVGYTAAVRMKRRELQVLQTFAEQTTVALRQARLFERVEAQRSRLSGIVENASDGILLADVAGTVLAWNPAMERITALPEAGAVGQPLDTALRGVLEDGARLSGEELLRRLGAADEVELSAHLIDGTRSTGHVVLAVAAARSSDMDPGDIVVLVRDVTAQREAQEAKEDFIATVSHELRTPLTPIKGYLKLLQRPGFCDDVARRETVLATLVEQAGQLERLVEDLLSVSRMRHGEFGVELGVADVRGVVQRAVRDLGIGSTRVVEQPLLTTPVLARCDPARLQQVLANLLSNADKYSPVGEPVLVQVLRHGSGTVEITVTDCGEGVQPEAREWVFEPFRRLGNHLTRTTRGTGLGLHIARQLIEAMAGRIWVDGEPGAGATFHVAVPAAELTPHAADETRTDDTQRRDAYDAASAGLTAERW